MFVECGCFMCLSFYTIYVIFWLRDSVFYVEFVACVSREEIERKVSRIDKLDALIKSFEKNL